MTSSNEGSVERTVHAKEPGEELDDEPRKDATAGDGDAEDPTMGGTSDGDTSA